MTAFSQKTIQVVEIIEQQGVATVVTVREKLDVKDHFGASSKIRSAHKRGLLMRALGQDGYQYHVAPDWRAKVDEAATPKFKLVNPLRCPANSIFQVAKFIKTEGARA